MSIAVIYWSGTGNTEAMAQAVEEGAKSTGAETILLPSAAFDASMVSQYDAIAFGCIAYAGCFCSDQRLMVYDVQDRSFHKLGFHNRSDDF